MYINANVINRQFELLLTYIHTSWTFPSTNQIRTGKSLEVFWFIILFKLQYFTSIPKANSRPCRRGAETQSFILSVYIESSCGFGYFSPITSKPWGSLLKGCQEYK